MVQQRLRDCFTHLGIGYQYATPFLLPHQQGKAYYLNRLSFPTNDFSAINWPQLQKLTMQLGYIPLLIEADSAINRTFTLHRTRLDRSKSYLESILPTLTLETTDKNGKDYLWEKAAMQTEKIHQKILAERAQSHTPSQLDAIKRFMNESILTLHSNHNRQQRRRKIPRPTVEERILFPFMDERFLQCAKLLSWIPSSHFHDLLYYVEESDLNLPAMQHFFNLYHSNARHQNRIRRINVDHTQSIHATEKSAPSLTQGSYDDEAIAHFEAQPKAMLLLPYEEESLALSYASAILNLHLTKTESFSALPSALFIRYLSEKYGAKVLGLANQNALILLSFPEPIADLEETTQLTLIIEQLYADHTPRYANYDIDKIAFDRHQSRFWVIGNH